ncbi:MAG: hypothetical protein SPJ42_02550 [Oscillospiraceae bacterium]|nr:hypothetical protein [Oscillospiraceae bacterium]
MKRFLALLISLTALLSFSSCGKNESEPPEETSQTEKTNYVQSSISSAGADEIGFKKLYENAIQNLIDDNYCFNGVYIGDTDGDGIPLVALSCNYAVFRIPNIIMNIKDGKITVIDDIINSGSGWSVIDEVFFCQGTDYVVSRFRGNTYGSFTSNKQIIYNISESGIYTIVREDEIVLPSEYEKEIEELHNSDSDFNFSKYQLYIKSKMDSILREEFGENAKIISFADKMTDFSEYLGDNQDTLDVATRAAIDYINNYLGTNIKKALPQGGKNELLTENEREDLISAYKNILSKCEDGNRYGLYDIDGNGVEELIVETGIYKRNLEWHIYTYDMAYKGNITHHTGSFDATYYDLYYKDGENALYLYSLVKECEELKKVTVAKNKATEATVVPIRPYDRENPINPGTRLYMTDYNDYSLLNTI